MCVCLTVFFDDHLVNNELYYGGCSISSNVLADLHSPRQDVDVGFRREREGTDHWHIYTYTKNIITSSWAY